MVIGCCHADIRAYHVRTAYPECMVVCYDYHDYLGICFLIGTFGHVAFRSEDHSGKTIGYGLCIDFLGTELGIDGCAFADRMGAELLLQRAGGRRCADV